MFELCVKKRKVNFYFMARYTYLNTITYIKQMKEKKPACTSLTLTNAKL